MPHQIGGSGPIDRIFLQEPALSETARRAGLVPPPAIFTEEVGDRNLINQRKRQADAHVEIIENKMVKYVPREVENVDLHDATSYRIGCQVGVMLPAIVEALPPVAANEIVEIFNQENGRLIRGINTRMDAQLAQMNAQFAQMNAQMNVQFAQMNVQMNAQFAQMNAQMNARFDQFDQRMSAMEDNQRNAAALKPNDILYAPRNRAGADSPDGLAQFTVSRMCRMGAADLHRLEDYYGIGHGGVLELRRQRVLQTLSAF